MSTQPTNLQIRAGGVVHERGEDPQMPRCAQDGDATTRRRTRAGDYREVNHAVTCKRCLKFAPVVATELEPDAPKVFCTVCHWHMNMHAPVVPGYTPASDVCDTPRAELTLEGIYPPAPRIPRNTDAPKVHVFASIRDAYDASQCRDEIADGDVLSVPSAGVVAVLVAAWPVAVDTDAPGEFHTLKQGAEWGALEYGDYTVSVTVARAVLAGNVPSEPVEKRAELVARKMPAVEGEQCTNGRRMTCLQSMASGYIGLPDLCPRCTRVFMGALDVATAGAEPLIWHGAYFKRANLLGAHEVATVTRAALPGERCTCGRQAVQVFVHDDGRETGYCGLPDGGNQSGPCPFCCGERHRQPWGDPAVCPEYSVLPKNQALIHVAARNFELRYATRSGITVKELRDTGRIVQRCRCGDASCEGWQSVSRTEIGQ